MPDGEQINWEAAWRRLGKGTRRHGLAMDSMDDIGAV